MRRRTAKNLTAASVAGLGGTALIRGMMAASRKLAPDTLPPMKDEPGHFMVKQAERLLPEETREKVPEKIENVVATALAFGYGATGAILYTAIRNRRTRVLMDGAALGTLTWATAFLGWLPATKLMPPLWKQKPRQVFPNIFSHVFFGMRRWRRSIGCEREFDDDFHYFRAASIAPG